MEKKDRWLAIILLIIVVLGGIGSVIVYRAYNDFSAYFLYQEGLRLHFDGQYEDAISQFDQAIERAPNYSNYYVSRGRSYYFQANFEETLSNLDLAIEVNPENAEAYLFRGSVRLDTFTSDPFDYEEGLSDLYRYLELEPDSEFRNEVEETIDRYES